MLHDVQRCVTQPADSCAQGVDRWHAAPLLARSAAAAQLAQSNALRTGRARARSCSARVERHIIVAAHALARSFPAHCSCGKWAHRAAFWRWQRCAARGLARQGLPHDARCARGLGSGAALCIAAEHVPVSCALSRVAIGLQAASCECRACMLRWHYSASQWRQVCGRLVRIGGTPIHAPLKA